jgi:hypothetical protein
MRYGRITWRAAVLSIAAGLLASAASWAAEPAARDNSGARQKARADSRPGAVTLEPGQAAPDVALYPLTFTADANGRQVGTIGDRKVKLSDYKGKAPIVIFSSSYT